MLRLSPAATGNFLLIFFNTNICFGVSWATTRYPSQDADSEQTKALCGAPWNARNPGSVHF